MIQRLQVKRNEKGFTLIELLIVIIVLGILAAIVVFAVGNTRKDAVASSCKTDVKSIELSAEAVMTKQGLYPTDGTHLQSSADKGGLLKAYPLPAGSGTYTATYASTDGKAFTVAVVSTSLKGGTGTDQCDKAA